MRSRKRKPILTSGNSDVNVVANPPDRNSYPALARKILFNHIKERLEKTDLHITFCEDEVYVVWFTYILGNWKAILSTSLPDGRYYEVTYNKDKHECYIDTYIKMANDAITFTD